MRTAQKAECGMAKSNNKNKKNKAYRAHDDKRWMDKSNVKFLALSFIYVIVIYVLVFVLQTISLSNAGTDTINRIGEEYLQNLGEHKVAHLNSLLDMQIAQVSMLLDFISADDDTEQVRRTLSYNSRKRGFDYLAFYTEEDTFDMIYGLSVEAKHKDEFSKSVESRDIDVTVGYDTDGEAVVLISMQMVDEFFTESGSRCTAIVAGFTIDYLKNTLGKDDNNDYIDYHIICTNGDMVLSSSNKAEKWYKESINGDGVDANNLEDALKHRREYANIFNIKGERVKIYSTALPYSNWNLVMCMRYGNIDIAITNLVEYYIGEVVRNCIIIIIPFLVIFIYYIRITRRHVSMIQEQVKDIERLSEAKSQFLHNMSHDIRTCMNTVIGRISLIKPLLENPESIGEAKKCFDRIETSSKYVLGIICNLLDMQQMDSDNFILDMKPTSLNELVDECVDIAKDIAKDMVEDAGKKFDYSVNIQDDIDKAVSCDKMHVQQVIVNILDNAIKFTGQDGRIELEVLAETNKAGTVGADDKAGEIDETNAVEVPKDVGEYVNLHVKISDDGVGISGDLLKDIFEPFVKGEDVRTQGAQGTQDVQATQGTGLGLTLANKIVNMFSGRIDIESPIKDGHGTSVRFNMLFKTEDVVESVEIGIKQNENSESIDKFSLDGLNILIAEDNDINYEILYEMLDAMGANCDRAADGQVCVDKFMYSKEYHYDMILMDIRMPNMNGREAAKEIRKLSRKDASNIPIIAVTSDNLQDDKEENLRSGTQAHLTKPVDLAIMLATMEECMRRERV